MLTGVSRAWKSRTLLLVLATLGISLLSLMKALLFRSELTVEVVNAREAPIADVALELEGFSCGPHQVPAGHTMP